MLAPLPPHSFSTYLQLATNNQMLSRVAGSRGYGDANWSTSTNELLQVSWSTRI